MKKVLLAAAAFSALAISVPAAAQSYDGLHQRFQNLEQRIERGVQRGLISRNEARGLRGEFRQLVRIDASYRRDGLTRWEAQDVQRRIAHLDARVRYERRDGERRYADHRSDHRYDDRRHDDRHDDRRYDDRRY